MMFGKHMSPHIRIKVVLGKIYNEQESEKNRVRLLVFFGLG